MKSRLWSGAAALVIAFYFSGPALNAAVLYGGHEAWRAVDELKAANTPVPVSLRWPQRLPDNDPASEDPLRVLEFRDKAPLRPPCSRKRA